MIKDAISKFLAVTDLVDLADRPLPTAPDGKYAYQVQAKQTAPPAGPTAADKATHSTLSVLYEELQTMLGQGPLVDDPVNFMKSALQVIESPDAIDDRDNFFVDMLSALCKLPQDNDFAKEANDKVITFLYNSLPHPPAAYIGSDPAGAVPWTEANAVPRAGASSASSAAPPSPTASWGAANGAPSVPPPAAASAPAGAAPPPPRAPWAFRNADGSGNNTWQPALGQSGRPYARDVENQQPQPANTLPDAGLVFDALLRSRGDFKPHPGNNSALTFAFASLVTHSLFRTAPTDPTLNNTTSYLDLSPLYGTNQAEQDLVRNKAEGRGLLWNDAFAEDRLVLVPPAASALLVIFSRNHNYIAKMLLKINERGRWTDPPPENAAKRAQQDEEIFQVARLVNGGHFMAMIFGDYVGGFLGLPRDGLGWSMNPFDPIKTPDGGFLGRGEGNHVSVEFNLLYRWHAVTAEKDIGWTKDLFAKIFPGKDPEKLQLSDFGAAIGRSWSTMVDPNPRTRTFGSFEQGPDGSIIQKTLQRGPDGSFADDDIADILQTATETVAGAYRARGHPAVFRVVEIMSIEQGRAWGVCTMNEFRTFLGLKPFADFKDWNSDASVAEAARQLYGHIDNLELYPGIQAEETMPLGPGSGICCGYTMTRAILGDAVALVRGDRFYTTDYTPANLTTWGFQDCSRDPNNGAFGAALPKLLMRHLPRHYPGDSVYSLFPFFTPEIMKTNLAKLKIVQNYSGMDGKRPQPLPVPTVVDTIKGLECIFKNPSTFTAPFKRDMKLLAQNHGFFLMFDDEKQHARDAAWAKQALFPNGQQSIEVYAQAYKRIAENLLKSSSYTMDGIPGTRVDIVGNVINLISVQFVADHLLGVPLKTKADPKGLFTPQEVYDMLSLLYTCALMDVQPEHVWLLEHSALQVVDTLREIITQNVKDLSAWNPVSQVVDFISSFVWPAEPRKPFHEFLARLQTGGRSTSEIVAQALGLAIRGSMPFAQGVAQIVDFYMDDARSKERAEIVRLAQADSKDPQQQALLLGYIREAQRLSPQTSALLRGVKSPSAIPVAEGKTVSVQPGDLVFASIKNAHLNPKDFPDPLTVNPLRPAEKYQLQGSGFQDGFGTDFSERTVAEVIKVIFRLKNLRRAESAAGKLAGFSLDVYGTNSPVYLDDTGNLTYWPGSMTLIYD
ncbi:heme peroxidase [Phanerochaete sordida]|uniref:Heme peroxidase n=1 Tax=Phanerochaete sordida TaxID=48140 RepID=A0A9P3GLV6_9APHY|nr:heme peroxidase [Phanerochaete sordida]